jgi:hypothetical protein
MFTTLAKALTELVEKHPGHDVVPRDEDATFIFLLA